jgi:SAM-dependent methyltransferase
MLTDLIKAPWHDRQVSAEVLPFSDGTLGALVLFDVLHHLAAPGRFFAEATRVLRTGGRVIMCEPYVGPLSYLVYKFLHDEPLDMSVDPLREQAAGTMRDPFASNQAIPTLLFGRGFAAFRRAFPALALQRREYLSGPSYPASGGFRRKPLLPLPLWRLLRRVEGALPEAWFRLIGFRILVVLERTPQFPSFTAD